MSALTLFLGVALGASILHLLGWGAVFTALGLLLVADVLADQRRYRKPTDG